MLDTTLPWWIGVRGEAASFAFFSSGAIRRIISAQELTRLRELGVPETAIDAATHDGAATVSTNLFGI